MTLQQAAQEFLACRRIAVTGVSRNPKGHGSNAVAQRLTERGYKVFLVNPHASEINGKPCYPNLASIPGGVEAVVIGTRPEHALGTVKEAAQLGIQKVWMHRAFGQGSVSLEAAEYGRQHGLSVIEGGCPLMFGQAADGGHRLICWWLNLSGKLPKAV